MSQIHCQQYPVPTPLLSLSLSLRGEKSSHHPPSHFRAQIAEPFSSFSLSVALSVRSLSVVASLWVVAASPLLAIRLLLVVSASPPRSHSTGSIIGSVLAC
ncbi:hypothetical protein HN51_069146 [Arachis hypogaea]